MRLFVVRNCAILVLALGRFCVESSYEKSYEGYELLQIKTPTQHDRGAVKALNELDSQLDIWHEAADDVDVFVSPTQLNAVKNYLTDNRLTHQVLNDHSQRDIEVESTRLRSRRANNLQAGAAFDYDDFNNFNDILTELGNMQTRCRQDLGVHCNVSTIGKTHEDRDIRLFTMSREGTDRQAIWIDATIHAREWLATATHLKIMQHLVDDYPSNSKVKELVDRYDWYLLPVVNPDGYVYTWTTDRLWRKNRVPTSNASCPGIDLNRNFLYGWGVSGSSSEPCSIVYRGPSAASELETKALQAQGDRLGSSLMTSVHVHTYGRYWLIPFGSEHPDGSCVIADDHEDLMRVANATADAIERTFNTTWKRGSSCLTLYPSSGGTRDYFKAIGGVKHTAVTELQPGLGDGGFIATKEQIGPSFQEFWNGMKANIEEIEQMISEAPIGKASTTLAIVVCVLFSKLFHVFQF